MPVETCCGPVLQFLPGIEDKATFKCLGSTKETRYQDVLKRVRVPLENGIYLPVRLMKEDANPMDSKAVAFQCQLDRDGPWMTFGYVARELTDHVRKALDQTRILDVKFKWVKWRSWGKSGFGLYAAMDVVVKGVWPHAVHAKSSF